MRFSVVNLGCKVNRVESDELAASLKRSGGSSSSTENADVVIINTCTVTGEADKKTRKAIRRALRANKQARILVTGCAAAIDADSLAALDPRVEIIAKHALFEAVTGHKRDDQQERHERKKHHEHDQPMRLNGNFPTRVGVKVQDGCGCACTYCIVHVARGIPWSKSVDAAVEEISAYVDAGTKEIVITGINLGSYRDTDTGAGLVDLLEVLLTQTSDCRFRLSSIEPCDIDERLISLIAQAEGRICRHLHLPLQSGSSKVLKEMARPYSAADFKGLVDRLFASLPTLSLSTDIIVGFPGETEADFSQTLEVAQHCRFSKIHVFPYSKRDGTPAALRMDHIDAATKTDHVHRLTQLAETLRVADYDQRVGSKEQVLVEKRGMGMTESYYHIEVPRTEQVGSLVAMRLPKSNFETVIPSCFSSQ